MLFDGVSLTDLVIFTSSASYAILLEPSGIRGFENTRVTSHSLAGLSLAPPLKIKSATFPALSTLVERGPNTN